MLGELTNSLNHMLSQTQAQWPILLRIAGLAWGLFIINKWLLNRRLLYLGILPRHLIGLAGIIFAPLLHANFDHLFFNTIPFLVLGNFVLFNGFSYFIQVTFLLTIISGFLIWCFGKPGLHIGASALITGYWGLLVSNIYLQGYQQGSLTAIILGIVCLYYFAGIFLGIFPREKGVSWEGHLFGLLAGVGVSYYMVYL